VGQVRTELRSNPTLAHPREDAVPTFDQLRVNMDLRSSTGGIQHVEHEVSGAGGSLQRRREDDARPPPTVVQQLRGYSRLTDPIGRK
jgi:hypothetical protein